MNLEQLADEVLVRQLALDSSHAVAVRTAIVSALSVVVDGDQMTVEDRQAAVEALREQVLALPATIDKRQLMADAALAVVERVRRNIALLAVGSYR